MLTQYEIKITQYETTIQQKDATINYLTNQLVNTNQVTSNVDLLDILD